MVGQTARDAGTHASHRVEPSSSAHLRRVQTVSRRRSPRSSSRAAAPESSRCSSGRRRRAQPRRPQRGPRRGDALDVRGAARFAQAQRAGVWHARGDRKALERVFISTDHNKADFGKLGLGHTFDVTPGFGKQVSSKIDIFDDVPVIGTASRFLRPSAERAKRNPQVFAARTPPSPPSARRSTPSRHR